MTRRGRWSVMAAILVAIIGFPTSPAHATAYRYWTYWHANASSSAWTFAGSGPTYRPADHSVEGWRFAVSQGTTSAPQPRTDPSTAYSSACAGITPSTGKKVVALVIDYGTAADAPHGEKPPSSSVLANCYQIPSNANGLDVLRAAGISIRQQDGLTCALNGYPKTECAPVVTPSASHPTPTTTPTPIRTATPTPTPTHASPGVTPTKSASHTSAANPSATRTTSGNSTTASAPATSGGSPTAEKVVPSSGAPSQPASSSVAIAESAAPLVVANLAYASGHGRPWPLLIGLVLLLALGAGAGLRSRRRR